MKKLCGLCFATAVMLTGAAAADAPSPDKQKGLETVCAFLKEAGVYYLATVDGDQPRVRPFGTALVYEGKLYIQTGRKKKQR